MRSDKRLRSGFSLEWYELYVPPLPFIHFSVEHVRSILSTELRDVWKPILQKPYRIPNGEWDQAGIGCLPPGLHQSEDSAKGFTSAPLNRLPKALPSPG